MNDFDLTSSHTIQFELWQECNNSCDFCFLGEENKKTTKDIKIQSLQRVLKILQSEEVMSEYNTVGFIGGEFFQGQLNDKEVRSCFFDVIKKTAELYNANKIRQVWIPATLNIGNQDDLYEALKLFKNWDQVWIITSWDTMGRFKTRKMIDTWDFHMKKLRTTYPGIKFNITTILTGDFIEKYLNNSISLKKLMNDYSACLFFKQCGIIANKSHQDTIEKQTIGKIESNKILPNFFPTRSQFLKFLAKVKHQESEDVWNRICNVKYRADKLYRNFNDGGIHIAERYKDKKADVSDSVITECGHPMVYRAYIDSDACVMCDKMRFE